MKSSTFLEIMSMVNTYLPTNPRDNVPKSLILHSTRNYPRFEDVLAHHKQRGWDGVGYHLFVDAEGKITQGRPFNKEGAHAIGFNTSSIGLCIYSKDGTLVSERVERVKMLINLLNRQFSGLELLSHTQAQVKYNNILLEKHGFRERFSDGVEVVRNDSFAKLQNEMQAFAGKLGTEKYGVLKGGLKSFKNCPGEMYLNFI